MKRLIIVLMLLLSGCAVDGVPNMDDSVESLPIEITVEQEFKIVLTDVYWHSEVHGTSISNEWDSSANVKLEYVDDLGIRSTVDLWRDNINIELPFEIGKEYMVTYYGLPDRHWAVKDIN